MQPISIVGPGATDLAGPLADRLDGRVAVVDCEAAGAGDGAAGRTADSEATDGGVALERDPDGEERTGRTATAADTTLALGPDGSWTGRGRVDGLDDLLDGLAPEHDYLVAVGESRLRVPTVLLGADAEPSDVPGSVLAAADAPDGVDLDRLVADLADAEPWITRETLVRRVEASADADRSGAIASFTGRVRARDAPDDDPTTHLAFEKYEGVAEDRLNAIADEITDRDGVFDVRMHHRTGVIEAGEDIVFVVVLAGHRREAFRAVEDGIDRLKDEVPIFKKEATESETFWVHRRD
ncbi:molybdopterin synthase [Halorubrum sp. LN27]|uniref:molybdopterin synthase n=1 Tax=Halorubrum sp. LN27 TaxID=2801032 RepID=UPI00190BC927|nr:molybdopterin synthase [Halorubrum sp. LN27]